MTPNNVQRIKWISGFPKEIRASLINEPKGLELVFLRTWKASLGNI